MVDLSPSSPLGMQGPPRPSCDPNPCHPGVKCIETAGGIKCGSCPEGMVGNSTRCMDVDEVGHLSKHPHPKKKKKNSPSIL